MGGEAIDMSFEAWTCALTLGFILQEGPWVKDLFHSFLSTSRVTCYSG